MKISDEAFCLTSDVQELRPHDEPHETVDGITVEMPGLLKIGHFANLTGFLRRERNGKPGEIELGGDFEMA